MEEIASIRGFDDPSPKIAAPHLTSFIDANYIGVLIRLLNMNVPGCSILSRRDLLARRVNDAEINGPAA
jgi:hypothetical protein